MRIRRRTDGRREAAIGLGAYAVYLLSRRLVVNDAGRARAARNAQRLVELEERLGLHVEPALQRSLLSRRRLCHVLNLGYVTLNVLLTVGVPMRLWWLGHPRFPWLRRAIGLVIVGASPVYLVFPVDPPRTLDHLTDTVKDISGLDLDTGLAAQLYNPIAAFPSIHCAFAVVTAAGVIATSESRGLRAVAAAYPPAVAYTVFATGNHYVVDAVAGSALAAAALRVSRALER